MAETALATGGRQPLHPRPAVPADAGRLYTLTRPLQKSGDLRTRRERHFKTLIHDFFVIEKDAGTIIACAALHPHLNEGIGELACIATHQDCRGNGLGQRLLKRVEQAAMKQGLLGLFAVSTRAVSWFREQGFQVGDRRLLPAARKLPPACRGAHILFKPLS